MKRIFVALILLTSVLTIHAQERRVQNRPYTDLRDFHFGVLVGTHLQDLELNNVGPQMVDLDDGNGVVQKIVSADQDRWDAGFTVGVLGELRLNSTFQLRMAPAMYFGTRHLTFRNITDLTHKESLQSRYKNSKRHTFLALSISLQLLLALIIIALT